MTKMVIGGVAYDTETATFVAMGEADPDGQVGSQASWSLYKTRHGTFSRSCAATMVLWRLYTPSPKSRLATFWK
jgi:hypothetical protein